MIFSLFLKKNRKPLSCSSLSKFFCKYIFIHMYVYMYVYAHANMILNFLVLIAYCNTDCLFFRPREKNEDLNPWIALKEI